MRSRILHPDFWSDEKISEVSHTARLIFQGLWCLADREGRLEYRPKYFRGLLFPYEPKIDIRKHIKELASVGLIYAYKISERIYVCIPSFKKYGRPHNSEKNSILPGPKGPFLRELTWTHVNSRGLTWKSSITDTITITDTVTDTITDRTPNQSTPTKRPTLDQVKEYCQERKNTVNPEKWFDYYSSNGWKVGRNSMKDWRACVRTWEKNDRGGSNDRNQDKSRPVPGKYEGLARRSE